MKKKLMLGVLCLMASAAVVFGLLMVFGRFLFGKPSDGSGAGQKGVNTVYELNEEDIVFDEEGVPSYVSGVVSVWFTSDASEDARQTAIESVGGEEIGRLDTFGQVQIRVDAESEEELEQVCMELEENDCVDFAELERLMQSDTVRSVPNDPWESGGVLHSSKSYWADLMDVPEAWALAEQYDATQITLGVLDNGFDINHEDIVNVIEFASDADVRNRNVREHGTHVAGLMAASMGNDVGLAGVVPNAQLLCYDGSSEVGAEKDDLFTDSQILMGFGELIARGAKVVNFSQGWNIARTQDQIDGESRMYSRAVGMLLDKGYDFIVVQSAGNEGIDAANNGLFSGITKENCDERYASFSDIDSNILIVGACDGNYEVDGYDVLDDHYAPDTCEFSNYGSQVDIYAPGEDVYSTLPDDSYGESDGTSMASPLVAGVCGLAWSVAPSLSGAEITDIVRNAWTTETSEGSPVVNADSSVRHALIAAGKIDERENEVLIYQKRLMSILDGASSMDNGNPVSLNHGDRVYYGFAIGDVDGDGALDLFLSYEQRGVDALCNNTVYTFGSHENLTSASSAALQGRIVDARFYQSGAIELMTSRGTSYRYFMGASPAFADATGIRENDYYFVANDENGYSCGRGSAFEIEPESISQDYYDRLLDALTQGGPSKIAFQPFTEESVKDISAKKIPASTQMTGLVMPDRPSTGQPPATNDEQSADEIARFEKQYEEIKALPETDSRFGGTMQEMRQAGADQAERLQTLMNDIYEWLLTQPNCDGEYLASTQSDWESSLNAELEQSADGSGAPRSGNMSGIDATGIRISRTEERVDELLAYAHSLA